jgi:hypothetical protein
MRGGTREAWLRHLVVLALLAVLLPGCISRKLFLKSDPPGATVILDGQVVGTTPYSEDLPAYGTRHLVLEAPGHARLEADLELDTPWYEWWPLDMFTELLWPWTIHDHRYFEFTLEAQAQAQAQEPVPGDWTAAEETLRRVREARPGAPDGEE